MFQFPLDAVANCHKFSGLKTTQICYFTVPWIRSPKVTMLVNRAETLLKDVVENLFPNLSSSRNHLETLIHGP